MELNPYIKIYNNLRRLKLKYTFWLLVWLLLFGISYFFDLPLWLSSMISAFSTTVFLIDIYLNLKTELELTKNEEQLLIQCFDEWKTNFKIPDTYYKNQDIVFLVGEGYISPKINGIDFNAVKIKTIIYLSFKFRKKYPFIKYTKRFMDHYYKKVAYPYLSKEYVSPENFKTWFKRQKFNENDFLIFRYFLVWSRLAHFEADNRFSILETNYRQYIYLKRDFETFYKRLPNLIDRGINVLNSN